MNSRVAQVALLTFVISLAACGSAPVRYSDAPVAHFNPASDPYWENPRWDKTLLDTVQASVRNPVDAADMSTPVLHAVIKFTYLAGTVEYPEIIQSTGDAGKDELLLHQVAAIQLPVATGIDADKPHEFVLEVDMPTPFEAFEYSVFRTIDYAKVYPKESIIRGVGGIAKVDFDYQDGHASSIVLGESSKSKDLDQASIKAVTRAVMPAAPVQYAGKLLNLEVVFCYVLGGDAETLPKNQCPAGKDVILVHGWRVRRF